MAAGTAADLDAGGGDGRATKGLAAAAAHGAHGVGGCGGGPVLSGGGVQVIIIMVLGVGAHSRDQQQVEDGQQDPACRWAL